MRHYVKKHDRIQKAAAGRRLTRLAPLLLAVPLAFGLVLFSNHFASGGVSDNVTVDQNAYINGSTTPQNGTQSDPQVVATGDTLLYQFAVDNEDSTSATPPTVPNPTFGVQNSLPRPVPINFKNGSFETPVVPANALDSNIFVTQGASVGWYTTASDGQIEIQRIVPRSLYGGWAGRFADHTMDGGTQYAELNANMVGTLYQDCATVPGTKVYYEFYHGARGYAPGGQSNIDVMNFYLRSPSQSSTTGFILQSTATCYTDPTGDKGPYVWTYQQGEYTIPPGQTTTRFAYESVSATGGSTYGNYLDGIRFYTSAYIELAKSNNAPNKKAKVGDTVTYTIVAKNTGESDSRNSKVIDTLPAGTELVPNSVRIDGALTPNFTYDATSRLVTVNVGAGATANQGGMIKGYNSFSLDCNNSYTVTFQVKVNNSAIAENLKYENQATVTFEDRLDSGTDTFTNYSNVDDFSLDIPPVPASYSYTVPDGLDIVDYTVPDGATASVNGQTITWTWPNLPHGISTLSVTTKVNPQNGETEFTSTGTLAVDGGNVQSNTTYHRLFTDFNLQKDAYINDSPVPQDGTDNAYQVVTPGDTIRYEIKFDANIGGSGLPSDRSDNPTFESPATNPDPSSGSFLELDLADDAPGGMVQAGDTVNYTLQVTNSGADDASGVQISQVLPAGTDFVAGTVRVNGLLTGGYNYNSVTRELAVNVGAGASSSNGGLVKGQNTSSIDCDDTYTVTYQVQVNDDTIAENLLYESQAKVDYFDRVNPSTTSSVNYSNIDSFARNAGNLAATVVDTIPDGMTIVSYEAPAGSSFAQVGQTATWSWDSLTTGEHTVAVTVSVGSGPQSEFVNHANVTIADVSKDTNSTYHTTKIQVTERFIDRNNPSSPLQPDNVIDMTAGQDYSPSPGTPPDTITSGGKTYKYWGYQVDGGQVFTGAPDPAKLPQAIDGPHTISFLYIDGTASAAQKNAFLNGGAVDNGTSANPVQVQIGDDLTYQISIDNPGPQSQAPDVAYDVLFVVDWSNSMRVGAMTSAGSSAANGIMYAKNISQSMSQYVLDNYPGSRVGLLGMYSTQANVYDINSTYIASDTSSRNSPGVDTPFVGTMSDFNSQIAPLFNVAPLPQTDDVAVFLRAGIDKMQGLNTMVGSDTAYNPRSIIPRDDQTRIPVIVLISDFQVDQAISPNYWTTRLKPQADRFASAYPSGILMTVRMDTDLNSALPTTGAKFNTSAYDTLMKNNVAPYNYANRGWNFTKVDYNTSYDTALTNFRNAFTSNVTPPPPPALPSTVTDTVPDGLTIVSTDPAATIDGQTVTWDMDQLPAGDTVLTVKTQVAEDGTFNNTAHIATWNEDPYDTNTTYHKTIKGVLSFYKVDEKNNPIAGVQFSLYSRSVAVPVGQPDDWLVSDGSGGTWADPVAATSASDGSVSFTDLMPGDSYMLVETKTQPGYELPQGQWLVTVAADASVSITAHGYSATVLPPAFKDAAATSPYAGSLLLPNYRQMEMPFAGGSGVIFFTVLGIAVLGLAVVFLIVTGRRRKPHRSPGPARPVGRQ